MKTITKKKVKEKKQYTYFVSYNFSKVNAWDMGVGCIFINMPKKIKSMDDLNDIVDIIKTHDSDMTSIVITNFILV